MLASIVLLENLWPMITIPSHQSSAVSSRSFDLLNSMICDLKRSVNQRWLFDPVIHSSLDDLVCSRSQTKYYPSPIWDEHTCIKSCFSWMPVGVVIPSCINDTTCFAWRMSDTCIFWTKFTLEIVLFLWLKCFSQQKLNTNPMGNCINGSYVVFLCCKIFCHFVYKRWHP